MNYSQENLVQLLKLIGSYPNQQYGKRAHYEFVKTTNSAWPNQLFNLSANENEIEDVLVEIEEGINNGDLPNLLLLDPNSKNIFLAENIKQRNYQCSYWTAMTHNLRAISNLNPSKNFSIKQVDTIKELKIWLAIVEVELMGNKPLNHPIFEALLNTKNCFFFIGFQESEPVVTSLLFITEKKAGIYLIATREVFRKKGYGQAITNYCLEKAKALKCTQLDLQATNLGKPIYLTLGFKEEGLIDVYRLKPAN